MPTDITSSFNIEAFDKWEEGEDRLDQSWSSQITLRCLNVFDTRIRAMNKSSSRKEAWSKKFGFTLQNLFDLDQDKAYIVTPCGLYIYGRDALSAMMASPKVWFVLIKALNTLNNTLAIISESNLKIPKECFWTHVITLEAQDGKRYLLREQRYEIRPSGSKYLDDYDRWYDIDLGRFEP